MHGTFDKIDYAYDAGFNSFIASLYASGMMPVIHIVTDLYDDKAYYKRNRAMAVLKEDETEDCPVFGNWGAYYEFAGWLNYRAMSGVGNEFQLMAADVIASVPWPLAAKYIGIVHGLVTVQELYADRFGHYPADLNKFIRSYMQGGELVVMLCDCY